MHAGSIYLDNESNGRYGTRDYVERSANAIVGIIRQRLGALWKRIEEYFGGDPRYTKGVEPIAMRDDDLTSLENMKSASSDFQMRAKTMNSVTFDFIQANTAIISESLKARKKLDDAAVQAAQMATDIVRGRFYDG